jgi:hypothetical protein
MLDGVPVQVGKPSTDGESGMRFSGGGDSAAELARFGAMPLTQDGSALFKMDHLLQEDSDSEDELDRLMKAPPGKRSSPPSVTSVPSFDLSLFGDVTTNANDPDNTPESANAASGHRNGEARTAMEKPMAGSDLPLDQLLGASTRRGEATPRGDEAVGGSNAGRERNDDGESLDALVGRVAGPRRAAREATASLSTLRGFPALNS